MIAQLVEKKIEEGRNILPELSKMQERNGPAINVVYYVSQDVDRCRGKINRWQLTTRDILIRGYGESHRYVKMFEDTFTNKDTGFNFQREFEIEVNNGISVLESISELLSLEKEGLTTHDEKIEKYVSGSPKIFISHSSKDKDIIKMFVENVLLVGLGLPVKDIAFTSEEAFGVEPGESIANYIKHNIACSCIVLIMLSDNYKSSEVCLNEMGATWALHKKCVSVLLPGTGFDKLGWLTSLEKAVVIKEKSQISSLCEKIADLCGVDMKERFTIATQKIDEFVSSIGTTTQPIPSMFKKVKDTVEPVTQKGQSLLLFDARYTSICLDEGDYIIQLNVRMRAERENVTLRQVLLCNKNDFHGSTYQPLKQMEFNSFVKLNLFELSSDEIAAQKYLKEEYDKTSQPVMDVTIEKGHSISVSFIQFFHTIRQMDCYDELQLKGWSLLVKYNVDSEITIPLVLQPVDKDVRGMYIDK